MAFWARTGLLAATALFMLSLVPWPAQAGTQDDPEFIDADGDPQVQGVPLGGAPDVSDGVDLLKGWIEENDTLLVLALEVAGDITLLDPATSYQFDFHLTSNGTEYVATAEWEGSFAAAGVATAVAAEGSVLRLTVPKTAVQAFRADVITGLFAESSGTVVTPTLSSPLDRAPDSGSGRDYNVTMGFARGGSPTDVDGDGLLDAWETQHFGDIDAQNGTGDPDGDTLNNTAEQSRGTDPNNADTDGDLVSDADDEFPLDPTRPTDFDGDGLPDAWEREHFGSITAQDGSGDPDADTLTNAEEEAAGTDPNEADTDGDGFDDANDPFPLDPNRPGSAETSEDDDSANELRYGIILFAASSTFILLGLARGI